jgi:hypothetical protein
MIEKVLMRDIPTQDQLEEALQHARGFIHAAKRYLQETYGLYVSKATILSLVQEYSALDELVKRERNSLVEICMRKVRG